MYHGEMDQGIERQALHCMELIFTHPFTKETVHLISPLAEDMKSVDDTL
jgi:23S rRNA pseudouridine1911/1915/1917 synthase